MISIMHTLSIKIDEPLESTLATLVKRERVSKSELVRRALQAYATQRSGIAITATPSALDLAGDLVGCFSGAPADLSSNPKHMADFGRV
jgi:Arc/MetJ-type ribon-helix-helix transcriptional regulator